MKVLKASCNTVSKYLYIIYCKSPETATVPEEGKTSLIVPIHKNGSKSMVGNYRLISLCCISCKILEHIVYSNMMKHLEANNFFFQTPHGFRAGVSCTAQLIEPFHDIATAADNRLQADAIFIDFIKAFNSVSHELLKHKLSALSSDQNILKWIRDYPNNRKQCVIL